MRKIVGGIALAGVALATLAYGVYAWHGDLDVERWCRDDGTTAYEVSHSSQWRPYNIEVRGDPLSGTAPASGEVIFTWPNRDESDTQEWRVHAKNCPRPTVPPSTNTPRPEPTDTPVVPTATPTDSPTGTPVELTNTPIFTDTPAPTETKNPTERPTTPPRKPTEKPTRVPTYVPPTPTPTFDYEATAIVPTPTDTACAVSTPNATSEVCEVCEELHILQTAVAELDRDPAPAVEIQTDTEETPLYLQVILILTVVGSSLGLGVLLDEILRRHSK